MSDEPISSDSQARKWLKGITWAYIVVTFVGEFTGLIDRIVPLRYGFLIPYWGFALVMLAFRGPGLKGWLLVLLGWAMVAAATYSHLTR
jgi:hypothetical protein